MCYHYGRRIWRDIARPLKAFSPLTFTIIIISDFKEEEQVEKKTIEAKVDQLVEVEQSIDFSLESVEGRFFDVETNLPDIFVAIPTKVRSKCMMRHKGEETMEEGGSLAKVTQKQALAKGK